MDVAPWVPDDFWREWRSVVKRTKPDALTVAETWFDASKFFLGDEFSVVDATIMPVLWRLKRYGIELPAAAQPISRYAALMQARPSFRASLSPAEVAMSKG